MDMETINLCIEESLGLPLIVGFFFILGGSVQLLFPPRKINFLYGYRTKNSMKSEKSWKFAQNYSSKKMMLGGVFLLLASLIKLAFKINPHVQLIVSLLLVFAVLAVMFVMTERALKRKFS